MGYDKPLIQGRYRYADAHDMYRLLGVKSLPAEGMEPREIDGVMVYVKPLSFSAQTGRRRFSLRVMAICPVCQQHLAVGRMIQHICRNIGG